MSATLDLETFGTAHELFIRADYASTRAMAWTMRTHPGIALIEPSSLVWDVAWPDPWTAHCPTASVMYTRRSACSRANTSTGFPFHLLLLARSWRPSGWHLRFC